MSISVPNEPRLALLVLGECSNMESHPSPQTSFSVKKSKPLCQAPLNFHTIYLGEE